MNSIVKKEKPTDVVVRDITPPEVNVDYAAYAKLGWGMVLIGFVGFILWASFAPLDKGVPLSGSVIVATQRKAVQHLQGGTIDAILVKEGDHVKEGQVLVRMNDVQNKSQADVSRIQYFSARANEARLLAERDGKKSVTFPPELEKEKNDPRVAVNMQMQSQLFSSRQAALRNELDALAQSKLGLQSHVTGLEASRESKKVQIKILKEQIASMRELTADGFVARNRLLDQERALQQLLGAIVEDVGNIGRAKSQIAELSMRSNLRLQDYQKEVRTQLADMQREAESLQSRLVGQDFDVAKSEVRSPADGIVVGMAIFTKGGVVPGGFRMMDIVPKGDALVMEGEVPVHLIDKVHVGLPVEFIFSAFNQNTTPQIPGKVTSVSADRLVNEQSGQPYYKIKAEVTPEGLKKLGQNKVVAGMPVELFVKTGERTLASYLLKPFLDRARSSMSEE